MLTLTMVKGLPASGKSTWAKDVVVKSNGQVKRINKDDLRAMIDAGSWSKRNEQHILKVRDKLIVYYMSNGFSVVVDDTNLHPKHEQALQELAEGFNAAFEVKFFDTPVGECIKRDLGRPNSVGQKVIMQMYNQFLRPEPEVYHPPEDKPLAIICDIDGTLAHMHNRSPYEWDKVGQDVLDDAVASVLKQFSDIHIILMSGRDSVCRDMTIDWLKSFDIRYTQLFMRPEGDGRKDSIVKQELFDKHIRDDYQVLFVLDDRNQVVDMWRSMGLKVFQVEEGDF